jgi:hypothetical protein
MSNNNSEQKSCIIITRDGINIDIKICGNVNVTGSDRILIQNYTNNETVQNTEEKRVEQKSVVTQEAIQPVAVQPVAVQPVMTPQEPASKPHEERVTTNPNVEKFLKYKENLIHKLYPTFIEIHEKKEEILRQLREAAYFKYPKLKKLASTRNEFKGKRLDLSREEDRKKLIIRKKYENENAKLINFVNCWYEKIYKDTLSVENLKDDFSSGNLFNGLDLFNKGTTGNTLSVFTAEKKQEEEEEEEEEKEPDIVYKIRFQDKRYLKSKNTGIIYDYEKYFDNDREQVVVGKWNEESKKICFY